jgi:hypothetical protein
MFLYFYLALYSQRELMPIVIVFHFEHRHPNFSRPKKPVSRKIRLVKKFSVTWFQIRLELLEIYNLIFSIVVNIPAQEFFGLVQRKNFGQVLDSTKMDLKRFESFKQVQILIVWKIFLNIPAQKFFGPVQTRITRHITRYVSTDYAVLFGPRKGNPGSDNAQKIHS